ncbi:MAG: NUDIX hydrolase [Bacilli bacterium]|nr:NUDIX hydrolase [Bacilli bacterium]
MQPRVLKTGIALELPAGYIDEDETSLEAAKRELEEETGYTSESFLKLFSYYQDQGCSRVKSDCYLALDCFKKGDLHLDHDEHIKLFKETLTKVYELMEEGIINDAGSVITLEKARGKVK